MPLAIQRTIPVQTTKLGSAIVAADLVSDGARALLAATTPQGVIVLVDLSTGAAEAVHPAANYQVLDGTLILRALSANRS